MRAKLKFPKKSQEILYKIRTVMASFYYMTDGLY